MQYYIRKLMHCMIAIAYGIAIAADTIARACLYMGYTYIRVMTPGKMGLLLTGCYAARVAHCWISTKLAWWPFVPFLTSFCKMGMDGWIGDTKFGMLILILVLSGLATAVMYVCIVGFGKVVTGIALLKDWTDKMRSALAIAYIRH